MKLRALPVGAMLIVAAMMLAAIGVVQAVWADNLTIIGTVNTGTVLASFSAASAIDTEPQNVGTCTATIADSHTLNVAVSNAYPGYQCAVDFTVRVDGSIPAHVSQPIAQSGNPAWVTVGTCYTDGVVLSSGQTGNCSLAIGFSDTAGVAQNTTYNFGFDIIAWQYNVDTMPTP